METTTKFKMIEIAVRSYKVMVYTGFAMIIFWVVLLFYALLNSLFLEGAWDTIPYTSFLILTGILSFIIGLLFAKGEVYHGSRH